MSRRQWGSHIPEDNALCARNSTGPVCLDKLDVALINRKDADRPGQVPPVLCCKEGVGCGQNASDNDRQKDQPTNHRKQNDPPDDVCLARVSTLRQCMPKGALDALRVFCCSAVFNYFHTDTLAFDQNTAVAGARKARRCGAFRAPVKCLTARDTLMHREEVPRETRAAPVRAADLLSAHNHSALVLALPVDRHEVRVAACLARRSVRSVLHFPSRARCVFSWM